MVIANTQWYINQCPAHITWIAPELCWYPGWHRSSSFICYVIVSIWCPDVAKMLTKFYTSKTIITDRGAAMSTHITHIHAAHLSLIPLLPHFECNSVNSLNSRQLNWTQKLWLAASQRKKFLRCLMAQRTVFDSPYLVLASSTTRDIGPRRKL